MDLPMNIFDTSWMNYEGDFDTQVSILLKNIRLSREEVISLEVLVNDLYQTLRRTWPGCHIEPFGSIITGLGIRTSDIDLYLDSPQQYEPRHMVMGAKKRLFQFPSIFKDLFGVTAAKVPILKFYHVPTKFQCDLSFTSPAGVKNSQLIGFLLNQDLRVLSVAIVIKYWSKVKSLTGTNKVSNYTLTLLTIFYLQQKHMLPAVVSLQQHVCEIVNNWNSAFNDDIHHYNDNYDSIYELLGDFFRYYSNFDFNSFIVSTFLGKPIRKTIFQNLDNVPREYSLYKTNVAHKVTQSLRVDSSMCVQDPFEHSRNCSVAVHPSLFNTFIAEIRHAAKKYSEVSSDCYLESLLMNDLQVSKPTPIHSQSGKRILHKKPSMLTKSMLQPSRPNLNKVTKKKKRNKNNLEHKLRSITNQHALLPGQSM